ncbi:MAG: SulP family inorganic anion transporter [Candidatus Dormibacteraeota bacterium]|nr:SulP family inorganic anion transporter [Candidatus Dormibacteraeota bacterium]
MFASLQGYRLPWLRLDLLAGVAVWAVLAPQALAYASIAGVSPVVGLYAATAGLVLYAAFGSSKHLSVGPMAATAALSAAVVASYAQAGSTEFTALTGVLAIVTGVFALVAGLLRLGFLANFISEPVLKGFIVGLALNIVIGQAPKFFGVEGGSGDFFLKVWSLLTNLGHTNWLTFAIGLLSLALVLGLRRFLPVVPGSMVTVVLGIVAVAVFGLDRHGVAIVGHIEAGLPRVGLPTVKPADYLQLAPDAVGVTLVAFVESLGAAKVYAAQHHYEVSADRELLALGVANLGAGLAGGMIVNGSLTKTAVNESAGARTQASGLAAAALTILTLLFLTPFFAYLPDTTLAAVVIAAVVQLVDFPGLADLFRISTRRQGLELGVTARPDFVSALASLIGVLVFDTLPGLFIGIGISILVLVYRASRPYVAILGRVPGQEGLFGDVERHPEYEEVAGITVLRVDGGLFFANADYVRGRIRCVVAARNPHVVILDGGAMPYIDVTAVRMLEALTGELRRDGRELVLTRQLGQVRDVLRKTKPRVSVRTYASLPDAIKDLDVPAPPADESDGQ